MIAEKIGNIVTISKGRKHLLTDTHDAQSMRVLQIDDLRNDNSIKYTDDRNGVFANAEDVLIVWDGANAGTVGYGKEGFIGSTIALLRKKQPDKYDTNFIGKFLQSKLSFLKSRTTGATIPHVSRGALDSLKIPLIDINDQIRIATILSKTEALIAQRKESLRLLDELLKSTLLEMFGDPVRNERGWETSTIDGLCEDIIDCPHSTPIYASEKTDYFCVRSSDIVNGYFDLAKTYHVDESVFYERIKRYTPQAGDIVYSREGGRLGNAARIIGKAKICLGQRMMLFKVNEENRSEFLWALLESAPFKRKLQGLVGGGAAPRVNIKELKNIVMIEPPVDLQNKFAQIVEKVEALKARYQASLKELENLYGSLSQRAFKGEL